MSNAEKPRARGSRLTHVVNELCKSEHGMLSWLARGGAGRPSPDLGVGGREGPRGSSPSPSQSPVNTRSPVFP